MPFRLWKHGIYKALLPALCPVSVRERQRNRRLISGRRLVSGVNRLRRVSHWSGTPVTSNADPDGSEDTGIGGLERKELE